MTRPGVPQREALRGKVVVFRCKATGPTLGAPDLSPDGRLGLIAGIAVTHIDELLSSFAQYLRTPHLVVREARALPPGITQPRMLFLPTATVARLFGKSLDELRPGDTAPALEGDIHFEANRSACDQPRRHPGGTEPALRGSYVALGAHNGSPT